MLETTQYYTEEEIRKLIEEVISDLRCEVYRLNQEVGALKEIIRSQREIIDRKAYDLGIVY